VPRNALQHFGGAALELVVRLKSGEKPVYTWEKKAGPHVRGTIGKRRAIRGMWELGHSKLHEVLE